MTSEILFQENTEIDSIQQMITTIHNHIADPTSPEGPTSIALK